MLRKPLYLLALIVAICAAAGVGACSRSRSEAKRLLAVSIPPQAWLLEKIAGSNFDIEVIYQAGSDPETYEPTTRQIAALNRAEALFTIGGLPFENNTLPGLNDRKNAIVATAKGIERITDTHSGGDDPHIWTTPANLRVIARAMADKLIEIDPSNAPLYRKNMDALASELDSLDSQIHRRLEPVSSRSFLIWHPSLSYYARNYGLRQLPLQEEGKEASPRQLADRLRAAKEAGTATVVVEQAHDPQKVLSAAAEIGAANKVEINLMNRDIVSELLKLTDGISRR